MVSVRHAKPDDVGAMAELFEELDRFYGASEVEPLELRTRQINEVLFDSPPAAHALTAWQNGQLVGLASYSFLWPAVGLTRSLFLKELYVAEACRRSGVGKLLMQSLFEVATKNHCSRVEWTTDADNANAQEFYDVIGLRRDASKIFYRLEGQDLLHAAGGSVESIE